MWLVNCDCFFGREGGGGFGCPGTGRAAISLRGKGGVWSVNCDCFFGRIAIVFLGGKGVDGFGFGSGRG